MSSPKVIVLRGGSKNHSLSITTGANIVSSLSLYNAQPVDVYIDQEGKWYRNGLPVDPLHTLTLADAYIDIVNQKTREPYHDLAERLGVERLLKVSDFPFSLDRESLFRVMRQHGILTPETKVFRKHEPVSHIKTSEVFRTIMAPFIIRPLRGEESGVIAHTHNELVKALESILENDDAHVMQYKDVKTRTVVAMPQYRGEEFYMTLPLEVQVKRYEKPTREHRLLPLTYLTQDEKKRISDFIKDIYHALGATSFFMVDFIDTKKGLMVTHISGSPSLFLGGRFSESLATTGTDIAHYAMHTYEKTVEKKNLH